MLKLTACLIFILTNSVMAQAALPAGDMQTSQISIEKWVPTYAGETEVDGLPVTAILEQSQETAAPQFNALIQDSYVPSLLPVIKRRYRLNLVVSHNPHVHAVYEVSPKTVSVEGDVQKVFVSDANDARGFQFLVTAEKDGTLKVEYNRKVADGNYIHGDFHLASIPHTL